MHVRSLCSLVLVSRYAECGWWEGRALSLTGCDAVTLISSLALHVGTEAASIGNLELEWPAKFSDGQSEETSQLPLSYNLSIQLS